MLPTLAFAAAVLSQSSFTNYNCDTSICKLPSCKCANANMPIANAPQFILVTFDDAVQTELMPAVNSLFTALNPNGCNARGTFFTMVANTNPLEVVGVLT